MTAHILDEHRGYLADEARCSAYEQAIREVVRPGDAVLDMGAGTGILGLLACRAGARRVYSVDEGGIIGLAREICAHNGFGDRVEQIRGMSTEIDLPEKVDVVVADQIGFLGHEAGLIYFFADARRRHLKPGGALIPNGLELSMVPIESAEAWERVEFWDDDRAGFDFGVIRSLAGNTNHLVTLKNDQFLAEPRVVASIELGGDAYLSLNFEASFVVARPGRLHGIGGWWNASLSTGVDMSNSPLATGRIDRPNAFFPSDRPVEVSTGERIRVLVRVRPLGHVTWDVEVRHADGRRTSAFQQSTYKGMLISREDLQRTDPGYMPHLSNRGAARLSVLSLCDGRRPLVEIERETYDRHGDLFHSIDEASVFVADVVGRYAV